MPNNAIVIQNWYSTNSYNEYDVIQGLNIAGVSYYSPALYFSTIASNLGNNPSGSFIYAITSYTRAQDLATVNLTTTGATPNFARGSIYAITGLPDVNMNATGMILNANYNGGSSYTLQFINPGPPVSATGTSVGALNCPEPSWTTGFFFSPGYQSPWDTQQAVIKAQFEPGYQQRQPQSMNNNTTVWSLSFENRTDTEVKAIEAFVQNLQGVYSTTIMIPPNRLFNNPNLLYVLSNPKVTPNSYNQSTIGVTASQVFGS